MKNEISPLLMILKTGAVAGNFLFILWMLYNAVSSGFRGTVYEIISYVTLIFLLIVNSILILSKNRSGEIK